MDLASFNEPTSHPFNSFGRVETESFMWWFLRQCFSLGSLSAVVKTARNQDHLADDGLLKKVGEKQYQLTKESKAILYLAYGKD